MKFELKNIFGGYGKKVVLEEISLKINPGEIVSVLGPNGEGKSTLLKIAGRLQKPFSGSVLLDDQEIRKIPSKKLARRMAILSQASDIPEGLTVEELVALGRFPYRESSTATKEKTAEALESMEISNLRKRIVASLSGGERQRARLAMVLAQDPELLLLDEPTTFLDIRHQFEILELIRSLNKKRNISVLMVLHDISLASVYSDRMILLKEKKIHSSGSPEEIMKPEIIRDVFGIESKIVPADGKLLCLATATH